MRKCEWCSREYDVSNSSAKNIYRYCSKICEASASGLKFDSLCESNDKDAIT